MSQDQQPTDRTEQYPEEAPETTTAEEFQFDDPSLQRAREHFGDRFVQLWQGDRSNFPNQIEADLALCRVLAYVTQGDTDQTYDLARRSPSLRDRMMEQNGGKRYGDLIIEDAIKEIPQLSDSIDNDTPTEGLLSSRRSWDDRFRMWLSLREDVNRKPLVKTQIAVCANLLEDEYDFLVPQSEQGDSAKSTMYVYKSERGIYTPDGKDLIREEISSTISNILGPSNADKVARTIRFRNLATRDQLDAQHIDARLINLTNGVLDIDSRELLDHSPDFNFRTQIPVTYDPEAECTHLDSFLHDVTDTETAVETLYEWVGFALTPTYNLHRFLIIHGGGANGKGVLFDVLRAFLAEDNTSSVSLDIMTTQNSQFGTSTLDGSMLNIDEDVSGGAINSDELGQIKSLSGGDVIQVEEKYKSPYTIKNTAKLMFGANEPPRFYEASDALARRVLALEFPNRFTPDEDDGHKDSRPRGELLDELTTEIELSGLLNRALDALDQLEERGQFSLEVEASARERFADYMAEADPIVKFAQTCLIEDVPSTAIPKDIVYNLFTTFVQEEDGAPNPANKSTFWRELNKTINYTESRPTVDEKRVQVVEGIWLTEAAHSYLFNTHLEQIKDLLRNRASKYDVSKIADLPESADHRDSIGIQTERHYICNALEQLFDDDPVDRKELVDHVTSKHAITPEKTREHIEKLCTRGAMIDVTAGEYKLEPV